nr:hypothetical protein [Tanacetum cinerariifolium]
MARLQFCDYHNMVTILEKSEHNVDFHHIVDFVKASLLRYALTFKPTVYVSHIRQFWSTARIKTTEEGTKILATVDGIIRTVTESSLRRNLELQDEEGSCFLPDMKLFENLTLMGYNISPNQKFTFQKGSGTPTETHHTTSLEAQPPSHTTHSSPTLPPVTTTSIPTVTPSETTPIWQYTQRARIAQSSALPPVADELASPLRDVSQAPRVTSPAAVEGSMQQTIYELTAFCTSLQRQHSELISKFEAHELEINRLKVRVKLLEDREGVAIERSGDDAPINGRNLDEWEAAVERVSDDTKEMATVLTSMDAATVLASGVVEVPTGSGSIPTASPPANEVPTSSDVVPTTGPMFATAIVVTPYTRRKGKEVMIARDAKVARIHVEEKLQSMIDGLDRSNETVAKYLQEYQQFASELPLERRIELISNLVRYQDNYAKLEDFIPMGSKEEAERLKRKGLSLEQKSMKKLKTSEEVTEEAKSPDEVPEEKVKEMMQLVPIEEVYVEALQVKHPIIDWKVHTKGQRSYWKIIRLGGNSANY